MAADLYPLARGGDDPLDEVTLLVLWIPEHDDVAAPRRADAGQAPFGQGRLGTVEELVDQDVVPDQQRVHHRAGRDREGLDDEGTDHQRQQDRDRDRPGVLADYRLSATSRP